MTQRDSSADAAAALNSAPPEGDIDYFRGVTRSACPHDGISPAATLWRAKWDAAAEHASAVLRLKEAGLVRHYGRVRACLSASAAYLCDLRLHPRTVTASGRRQREIEMELRAVLGLLPKMDSATAAETEPQEAAP